MNVDLIKNSLASLVNESQVREDVKVYWKDEPTDLIRIELADRVINVPRDAPLYVLSRTVEVDSVSDFFELRLFASLGQYKLSRVGLISTQYCFLVIHYNHLLKITTIDYSLDH